MFDETGEVLPPKLTHPGTYAATQGEKEGGKREREGERQATGGKR